MVQDAIGDLAGEAVVEAAAQVRESGSPLHAALAAVGQAWLECRAILEAHCAADPAAEEHRAVFQAATRLRSCVMDLRAAGQAAAGVAGPQLETRLATALEVLDAAERQLHAVIAAAETSQHGVAGRFEWVDGPLTR